MPGAGGLNATNYLYSNAPQDGTYIGMVHSTIPLSPLWGSQGVRFDTMKFNWIGAFDRAPGVCLMWAKGEIKTWKDLLEKVSTVGSSGAGSQMDAYPALLNKLFGTKIKMVQGYKDGTEIYLAMERGEVDGRCGGQMSNIRATRPEWLTEHKIVAPIVISSKRHPDFPGYAHGDGIRQGQKNPDDAGTDDGVAGPGSPGADAAQRAARAGEGDPRRLQGDR